MWLVSCMGRLQSPSQVQDSHCLSLSRGVGFQRFCLLSVDTSVETQALYPGNSRQKLLLRECRCRKTKAHRHREQGSPPAYTGISG